MGTLLAVSLLYPIFNSVAKVHQVLAYQSVLSQLLGVQVVSSIATTIIIDRNSSCASNSKLPKGAQSPPMHRPHI